MALLNKKQRDVYVRMLHSCGEDIFYKKAIGQGMMRSAKSSNPEVRMLDTAEAFMSLWRSTGDVNDKRDYLIISKALRRAAHVVYRQMLKQNKGKRPNLKRFITSVA